MNVTDGSASVKLSRATKLSTSSIFPFESNAIVGIEEENGQTYLLTQAGKGLYQMKGAAFNLQKKYRLKVQSVDGNKYSSSFIEILQTPPIDSISWKPSIDGVNINVSSTGTASASRYYKWNYIETWKYHSEFYSTLKIIDEVVYSRFPEEQIYFCWRTTNSSQILINSTDSFNKNSISKFPLIFLPVGSEKLTIKYSVLVQQTSLTEASYNFFDQLQKTTQNLGGLFDPLPSKVTGNIINENNPEEKVLGYFYGSSMETKRIFISNGSLPQSLQKTPSKLECSLVNVLFENYSKRAKSLIIVSSYGAPFTVGYSFSYAECIDCRVQGGTTTEPLFWK